MKNTIASLMEKKSGDSLAEKYKQESISRSFEFILSEIRRTVQYGETQIRCNVEGSIVKEVVQLLTTQGFKVKVPWFPWGAQWIKISWA